MLKDSEKVEKLKQSLPPSTFLQSPDSGMELISSLLLRSLSVRLEGLHDIIEKSIGRQMLMAMLHRPHYRRYPQEERQGQADSTINDEFARDRGIEGRLARVLFHKGVWHGIHERHLELLSCNEIAKRI